MPTHELTEVSRAPSPKSYVYVSSSESETYSPPLSPLSSPPSPSPLPLANGEGEGQTTSRLPSRLSQEARIYFPSAEDSGDDQECTESIGSPWQQASSEPPVPVEGKGPTAVDGSTAKAREDEPQASSNNEELVRRVKQLERELEALKAATSSAVYAVAAESAR